MKFSLVLVVTTLVLVSAEQRKLWNMFNNMALKTEGGQKQELQEMMQMKKTVIKVIFKICVLVTCNMTFYLVRQPITVLTGADGRKLLSASGEDG